VRRGGRFATPAARGLPESMVYMRKWHADLNIARVSWWL